MAQHHDSIGLFFELYAVEIIVDLLDCTIDHAFGALRHLFTIGFQDQVFSFLVSFLKPVGNHSKIVGGTLVTVGQDQEITHFLVGILFYHIHLLLSVFSVFEPQGLLDNYWVGWEFAGFDLFIVAFHFE